MSFIRVLGLILLFSCAKNSDVEKSAENLNVKDASKELSDVEVLTKNLYVGAASEEHYIECNENFKEKTRLYDILGEKWVSRADVKDYAQEAYPRPIKYKFGRILLKDKSLNISKYKSQRFLFGKSHASSSKGEFYSFSQILPRRHFVSKKDIPQLQGFVDVGENDKCVVSEHEIRREKINAKVIECYSDPMVTVRPHRTRSTYFSVLFLNDQLFARNFEKDALFLECKTTSKGCFEFPPHNFTVFAKEQKIEARERVKLKGDLSTEFVSMFEFRNNKYFIFRMFNEYFLIPKGRREEVRKIARLCDDVVFPTRNWDYRFDRYMNEFHSN